MSQMEVPDEISSGVGSDLRWLYPEAAAVLGAFVDQGPCGVAVIDTDFRFLLVSPSLAALYGSEAQSIVGRAVEDVLPAPFGGEVRRHIQEVLESGTPILNAETRRTMGGPHAERSFISSLHRLDSASGAVLGVVALVTETTDVHGAVTAATSAAAQLELLQQVTEALSDGRTVADVAEVALKSAAQAVDASAAVLVAVDSRAAALTPIAATGLSDVTLSRLQQPAPLDAQLPHCDALRSRTIMLWGSKDDRDTQYPDFADSSTDHQAWALVPLSIKDTAIGVIVFAWRLDRRFGEAEVSLLGIVGRQCAVALEQARILDAERDARRAMEFLVEVTKFVVESSDDGVCAVSGGNRILTFNRRFCELLGLSESALQVGAKADEVLAYCLTLAADPDALVRNLVASRQRPLDHLAFDCELHDGRVMACNSTPIVDRREVPLGRVWYLRDETARRVHDAQQRVAMDELRVRHEHQAFLLEAAEIVAQADGYAETLERLAAVAVPTLADLCLVDTLTWDSRVVRMAAKHAEPTLQSLVDELGSSYAPDPSGAHPSIEVMRTGRVRWSATMSDDFLHRTTRDDHHFDLLKRLGFTSYMAVPLVAENRILGSITLVSAGSGRRFGPEDLALAEDFTSCVAQVVAAAQRHDAARHAAQTLQASLLPDHVPDVPGLAIAVRYLPATLDSDVGGDFYDVIAGGPDTVTIVIGDVAGHDMQAAAIMGKVRTAVRVLASQATGPGHFIEMLRRGWDNLELERMATLLVAHADARSGLLRIASAGHPPPLHVAGVNTRFLDVKPTTPLGAPRSPVQEWRGTLEPGAALLLFTDGLVESRHRSFEDGARELRRAASGQNLPEELCDQVLREMVLDELHHDDDIALVALARPADS